MSLISTSRLLKALADDSRLRILHLLGEEDLSGTDLMEILNMGQSRVSTHLNLLKEVGLVTDRREGRRAVYGIAGGPAAALLGQVRDRSGEVIGLHRTYLVQDANEVHKAPVSKPKMMLGRVAGGAVRLAPISADGRVALCEGIETGLAVMTACPDLPVWGHCRPQASNRSICPRPHGVS